MSRSTSTYRKILSITIFRRFLLSRSIYGFCIAGLPALLAASTVSAGGGVAEIGIVLGLGALPAVLGSLASPKILQRVSQRRIFSLSCILWIGVSLLAAAMLKERGVPVALLGVISFTLELVGSVLYPSIGSYLPQIVEKSDLKEANSLRSAVNGVVGICGPVLLTLTAVSVSFSVAWLTVSLLMCIALLVQIRLPAGKLVAPLTMEGTLKELRAGFQIFWGSGEIRDVVLFAGLWHLLAWSAYMVAGPLISVRSYGSVGAWGWFEGFFAAGGIFGGFLSPFLRGRVKFVCIVGMLPQLLVLSALALSAPIEIVCFFCLGSGLSLAACGTYWITNIQARIDEDVLPIVFAYDYLFSEGLAPIGYLLVPVLFAAVGISVGISVTVAFTLMVAMIIFASSMKGSRQGGK